MPLPAGGRTLPTMHGSYPVLWQDGATAAPVAGRLSLGPHSLSLHGGSRSRQARLEVPYAELTAAERSPQRLGPLRTIRFDSRHGGTVMLAGLGGMGASLEILEALCRIIAANA